MTRRAILFSAIIIGMTTVCHGQIGWDTQSSGVTGWLRGVCFTDIYNGWAVGDSGVIINTVDAGTTWTSQSSGLTTDLRSVFFISNTTGWVVGYNGSILTTSNGGGNWTAQTSGTTNDLLKVHFSDANNGWAVGQTGQILVTTNGGTNWSAQSSGTSEDLYDVHFIDLNNGWTAGGLGTILNTTDGGTNWNAQTSNFFVTLYGVHFANADTGWAVGQNCIIYTSDGGVNWARQILAPGAQTLYDANFTNKNTGWAVGGGGLLVQTKDGGLNWNQQNSGGMALESVFFVNDTLGWAVGDNGTIIHTTNGGGTCDDPGVNNDEHAVGCGGSCRTCDGWNRQKPIGFGSNNNSIFFLNSSTGWAAGFGGIISKTTDAGVNWILQTTATTYKLQSIYFLNPDTGWAAGQAGTILKTVNGGTFWDTLSSGSTKWFQSVFFTHPDTGFVVGSTGTVLKTTDGGINWITKTSGTTNTLYEISFINGSKGWAVGNWGEIIYSSDGGDTWSAQTSGTSETLFDICLYNANTAWISGTTGKILKTTNGGTSWVSQSSYTSSALRELFFIGDSLGWAVGNSGEIIHSSDGGLNWSSQNSGTTQDLYGVFFTSADTGWVSGRLNTILFTSNRGEPSCDDGIQSQNETGVDCGGVCVPCPSCSDGILNQNETDIDCGGVCTPCPTCTDGIMNQDEKGIDCGGACAPCIGWNHQSYSIFTEHSDIHAISDTSAWAGGLTTLTTTDAGSNWTGQTGSYGAYSHFVDSIHGWAVGSDCSPSCLSKTVDGGLTWVSQTVPNISGIKDIFFADTLNGWLVAGNGIILNTNDGGANWNFQTVGIWGFLQGIYFLNKDTGWVVGLADSSIARLLKTTDGGVTWINYSSNMSYNLFDVHFLNANEGWAVGRGGIMIHTTDGGLNWNKHSSGTVWTLNSIHFTDSNNGWAVGNRGTIVRTYDGGATWNLQKSNTKVELFAVHFYDENTGWAVGYDGVILYTSDGGGGTCADGIKNQDETAIDCGGICLPCTTPPGWFRQQDTLIGLVVGGSVIFLNPDTGYAATGGGYIRTVDGGFHWGWHQTRIYDGMDDIHFISKDKVIISGGIGKTWMSLDAGISWEQRNAYSTTTFIGLTFTDSLNGWAVGVGNNLTSMRHTSDGGQNWVTQQPVLPGLTSVAFVDANNGWITGWNGDIQNTIDGGATWNVQSSGTIAKLWEVFFIDGNKGWVVGDSGVILNTVNAGATWSMQPSGTSIELHGVYFRNDSLGWAVGDSGTVLQTSDGGQSWNSQVTPTTKDLNRIYFLDDLSGWIVGNHVILHTVDGGTGFGLGIDLGMVEIVDSLCLDTQQVAVSFSNFGSDTLYSVTINWAVNGVQQIGYFWNDTLLPGDTSALFDIGTYVLLGGTPYSIKAWTSGPNGGIDPVAINDSLVFNTFIYDEVDLGPDLSLCSGDSLALYTDTSYTSYNWTTGATDTSITVSTAALFGVTITDANGCVSSDSITVTIDTLPDASINPVASLCTGDAPVPLTAISGGGTWSGTGVVGSNFDASIAGAGAHSIYYMVINGSCVASGSSVITVNSSLQVNLGQDSTICFGDSLIINAGPNQLSYNWSTGDTTSFINADTTGLYWVAAVDTNGCLSSDSLALSVDTMPTATIAAASSLCTGDSSVSLSASSGGGIWGGTGVSGNSFDPSVAGAGSHSIYYTVINGSCTASDSTMVTVNSTLQVNIGQDAVICYWDSLIMDAGSDHVSYSWSTGDTASLFYTSAAGLYWVAVVDSNGCVSSDSLILSVDTLPDATITNVAALCTDDAPVSLSAASGGGTWSGVGVSGNNFDPVIAGSGIFTIVYSIVDSCGNASDSVDIVVNQSYNISDTGLAICSGDSTLVYGSYRSVSGTYYDSLITASGCDSVRSTVLTVNPTFMFSDAPQAICTGDSASIYGIYQIVSGTYYDSLTSTGGCDSIRSTNLLVDSFITVSLPDETICDGDSALIFGVYHTLAGMYYDSALAASGCDSISITSLIVNLNYNTSVSVTICQGDSVFLQGSYQNVAGAYTDVYTAGNSCDSMVNTALMVNPLPSVGFTGLDTSYCTTSAMTTLIGSPAGGIFIGTGVTGNIFDPAIAGAGTYNITYSYTDGNGCTNSEFQNVNVSVLPVVSFSGLDTGYCTTDAAVTLVGVPSGGSFSGTGISGNQFDPASAGVGTYFVNYSYTDANNCSDSVSENVSVSVCTGISNDDFANNLRIYPNPNTGEFVIDVLFSIKVSEIQIKITNTLGQGVWSEDRFLRQTGKYGTQVDLSGSAPGIYNVRVLTELGVANRKIIIE